MVFRLIVNTLEDKLFFKIIMHRKGFVFLEVSHLHNDCVVELTVFIEVNHLHWDCVVELIVFLEMNHFHGDCVIELTVSLEENYFHGECVVEHLCGGWLWWW